MTVTTTTFDEAEGRAVAALPKQVLGGFIWADRANHAGSRMCTAVLADAQGITIPGLTVTLEARAPVHVSSCFYLFTISRLVHGRRIRAYQLEVVPHTKRSHVDPAQVIYGPHEHFGEAAYATVDPMVTCGDWQSCYRWFLARCTLQAPNVSSP